MAIGIRFARGSPGRKVGVGMASAAKELLKRAKIFGEVVSKRDSWINAVTGLGTAAKDKSISNTFQRSAPLPDETLEALYNGDPFAAKIIEKLPLEAFRQGFILTTSAELEPEEKQAQETALRDRLDVLGATRKSSEAAIWGRCFGGGIMFMGANDGQDVREPLDLERIQSVNFITVMDKRDLYKDTLYDDPSEPKFGEVKTYRFNPISGGTSNTVEIGTIIHESRLIVYPGVLTSQRERQYLQYWDHSVLHRCYPTLRASGSDWGSVSTMLADASQGILKIKDFYEVIAGGAKDTFETRLAIVDLARFVGRIMPIDVEEEFTYQERTFTGVADLLDKSMLRLAGAADMPVTVLMGQSPAGMNSTGESDQTVWFNSVDNERSNRYTPLVDRMVSVVAYSVEEITEPDTWGIEWPSLWQMSPVEESAHRKAVAETDNVYISAGVLEPEEVTAERFGGESYSDGPPMVNLEGREVPEPEPEPGFDPFQEPPPFEVPPTYGEPSEGSVGPGMDVSGEPPEEDKDRQDSYYQTQGLHHDLLALKKLSLLNAPQSLLKALAQRALDGLGFHSEEVFSSIVDNDFSWIGRMDTSRKDSWGSSVPPAFITDLESAIDLAKVNAPQVVLQKLVSRVTANLGLMNNEIQADIEASSLGLSNG